MTFGFRARSMLLALLLCQAGPLLRAQSLTTACGGSINLNSMIVGHTARKSISCYATHSGTRAITSSSVTVYLSTEPESGSSTLPVSSIGVSTDGSSFTTFNGTGSGSAVTVFSGAAPPGSSSPLTIYVQITVPSGQTSGQYMGTLMIATTVTWGP